MLDQQFYNIILMDVQMPQMDGITATKKIRNSACTKSQPYIIALTANTSKEDRENCFNAGMNDYIRKPIIINELVTVLSKITYSNPI